ncbi:Uncharacterised protein [Nocardia africana]|uniref:Uncharacterized protein n=1 Tax=Nocardia africana TaxID=134964 RepID=A0A378X4Y7_9NOCA|nr:Uncharacterised protein [Nocardia africana]
MQRRNLSGEQPDFVDVGLALEFAAVAAGDRGPADQDGAGLVADQGVGSGRPSSARLAACEPVPV